MTPTAPSSWHFPGLHTTHKHQAESKFYTGFLYLGNRYLSAIFVPAINMVSCSAIYTFLAVLGVHNMVNNPKFDEGGARSKDGKEIVRSKQTFILFCGLYINLLDTYRLGVLV